MRSPKVGPPGGFPSASHRVFPQVLCPWRSAGFTPSDGPPVVVLEGFPPWGFYRLLPVTVPPDIFPMWAPPGVSHGGPETVSPCVVSQGRSTTGSPSWASPMGVPQGFSPKEVSQGVPRRCPPLEVPMGFLHFGSHIGFRKFSPPYVSATGDLPVVSPPGVPQWIPPRGFSTGFTVLCPPAGIHQGFPPMGSINRGPTRSSTMVCAQGVCQWGTLYWVPQKGFSKWGPPSQFLLLIRRV
jgi:hypothetical protein